MTRRGGLRVLRRIELALFAVGLVILGYCGAELLNSHIQQIRGERQLDEMLRRELRSTTPGSPPAAPKMPRTIPERIPEGSLVGRVEIPKLHLSAVVFQGTGDRILARGVGHLDSSALPGQPGNVVLAAHRDTFFRSLRNIRPGDDVLVTTPKGVGTYTVVSTEVVKPNETSVMGPTASPTLTLITCYPFYYVGHAPRRFIVRATGS